MIRFPRAELITSAGVIVPEEVDVTQTALEDADTFRAGFPIQITSLAFWSSEAPIDVEVKVNGVSLINGIVDHVNVSLDAGKISINGRDKSGKLMDKKSTEQFRNKTPDQIVKEIAGRHGLSVSGGGTSGERAGKQHNVDYARLPDHISEWSLIQHLAEREGKVAYVRGSTLYFVEPFDQGAGGYTVWYVPPTPVSHAAGNWTELHFKRNLQAAKPTSVKVEGWHSKKKQKASYTSEAPGKGDKLEYSYRYPQITPGQAKKISEKRLRENTRHEMTCEADIPGDASINPRGTLTVRGTNSAFDHTYQIDAIEHRISQSDGYRMRIRAKNESKGRGGSATGPKMGTPAPAQAPAQASFPPGGV